MSTGNGSNQRVAPYTYKGLGNGSAASRPATPAKPATPTTPAKQAEIVEAKLEPIQQKVNGGVSMSGMKMESAKNLQISVNKANLEANIKKIRSTINELDNVWNDIKNKQIKQIENSWAGAPAEAYINKVLNTEVKVNAVKEALELMAKSYSSAVDEIDSKQNELTNRISGM